MDGAQKCLKDQQGVTRLDHQAVRADAVNVVQLGIVQKIVGLKLQKGQTGRVQVPDQEQPALGIENCQIFMSLLKNQNVMYLMVQQLAYMADPALLGGTGKIDLLVMVIHMMANKIMESVAPCLLPFPVFYLSFLYQK